MILVESNLVIVSFFETNIPIHATAKDLKICAFFHRKNLPELTLRWDEIVTAPSYYYPLFIFTNT